MEVKRKTNKKLLLGIIIFAVVLIGTVAFVSFGFGVEGCDLRIEKEIIGDVSNLQVGDEFKYKITVFCDGPFDATNVKIFEYQYDSWEWDNKVGHSVLTKPNDAYEIISVDGNVGELNNVDEWDDRDVGLWTIDYLAADDSATITITVKVTKSGNISSFASVYCKEDVSWIRATAPEIYVAEAPTKVDSNIEISSISTVAYGEKVNIEYMVENPTDVTYSVSNDNGVVIEETSIFDIDEALILPGLNAGDYTITITNAENDDYNGSTASADFTVEKAVSKVNIDTIEPVTYGKDAVVKFTMTNASIITYVVKDKDGKVVIEETEITDDKDLALPGLNAGDYTITITNAETDNYTGSTASAEFTVEKADSNIKIEDIEPVTYGKDVIVKYAMTNGNKYTYIVKDKEGKVVIEETTITNDKDLVLSNLAVGDYTITITNAENDNYNGSTASADFTVEKAVSKVEIEDIEPVTYGKDVIVKYTMTNGNKSTYIVKDKEGKVVIEETSITNDKDLVLSNLEPGDYTITITNAENDNYGGSTTSASFTVKSVISNNGTNIPDGDGTTNTETETPSGESPKEEQPKEEDVVENPYTSDKGLLAILVTAIGVTGLGIILVSKNKFAKYTS